MPHAKKYYLLLHMTGVNPEGKGCAKHDMCVDLEGLRTLRQTLERISLRYSGDVYSFQYGM